MLLNFFSAKLLLANRGFFNWHMYWSTNYQLVVLCTQTALLWLSQTMCRSLPRFFVLYTRLSQIACDSLKFFAVHGKYHFASLREIFAMLDNRLVGHFGNSGLPCFEKVVCNIKEYWCLKGCCCIGLRYRDLSLTGAWVKALEEMKMWIATA